jgi:hypothetical protein
MWIKVRPYGSHPSQNFFLREYTFAAGANGVPTSTGALLESTDDTYSGGVALSTPLVLASRSTLAI